RQRILRLELLPHLEDQGCYRRVIDAALCRAQALCRDSRHVTSQRGKAPFLGAGRHASQLQQLQRQLGVESRRLDLGRPTARRGDPTLTQVVEESIHASPISRKIKFDHGTISAELLLVVWVGE